MNRRQFIKSAAVTTAASLPVASQVPPEPGRGKAPEGGGLIIREKDPENLEFPFATLDSFLTPNERFYIRSHFTVPKLEVATWRLKVEGSVDNSIELTFDDLQRLPSRTLPVTLECAGNSRVFLTPTAAGAQWELGAVSTAEWTGVPLSAVLERAGVKRGAVDVVLEGADTGMLKAEPKPPDAVHFARSVPISMAMGPDVLLAYRMNGKLLNPSHGYPLRAIVPGWYGMASVKWLSRIVVMDQPFHGHYQTIDYAYWERRNGIATRVPLTEMQVKAAIAQPSMHETVPAGRTYRIHGAAWTSGADITQVEVSTDGGSTWGPAKLLGRAVPNAWRMWEFGWRVPREPGRITLMARATDSKGRTQPMKRDPDRQNYMISHVLPIDVDVV